MTAIPKCKESAYWKHKEGKKLGGFDHEFFHHHALYVGYNVTNTLYTTIKAGKGVWGLAPRNICRNAFLTTLEKSPLQVF